MIVSAAGGARIGDPSAIPAQLLQAFKPVEPLRVFIMTGLADGIRALSSRRLSGIKKGLTIETGVLAPLIFLAGSYGKNFSYKP